MSMPLPLAWIVPPGSTAQFCWALPLQFPITTGVSFALESLLSLMQTVSWYPETIGPVGTAVECTCSIRVLPFSVPPTAHALAVEVAATPLREPAAGAGLGACIQVVPSQCSITVWELLPVLVPPTAQALVAEVVVTPLRNPAAGGGLGTCRQVMPSQCSITVWELLPVLVPPTAQALVAEVVVTNAWAV